MNDRPWSEETSGACPESEQAPEALAVCPKHRLGSAHPFGPEQPSESSGGLPPRELRPKLNYLYIS